MYVYIYIYIYIYRERERDRYMYMYISISLSLYIYIYIYVFAPRGQSPSDPETRVLAIPNTMNTVPRIAITIPYLRQYLIQVLDPEIQVLAIFIELRIDEIGNTKNIEITATKQQTTTHITYPILRIHDTELPRSGHLSAWPGTFL